MFILQFMKWNVSCPPMYHWWWQNRSMRGEEVHLKVVKHDISWQRHRARGRRSTRQPLMSIVHKTPWMTLSHLSCLFLFSRCFMALIWRFVMLLFWKMEGGGGANTSLAHSIFQLIQNRRTLSTHIFAPSVNTQKTNRIIGGWRAEMRKQRNSRAPHNWGNMSKAEVDIDWKQSVA